MIYFYSTMDVSIKNCLNNIMHSTNDETNESDSLSIMKTSCYNTDNIK